jgi:hypothetical protein
LRFIENYRILRGLGVLGRDTRWIGAVKYKRRLDGSNEEKIRQLKLQAKSRRALRLG